MKNVVKLTQTSIIYFYFFLLELFNCHQKGKAATREQSPFELVSLNECDALVEQDCDGIHVSQTFLNGYFCGLLENCTRQLTGRPKKSMF